MSRPRILALSILVTLALADSLSGELNGSVDSATGILSRDLERKGRSFTRELEQELLSWNPESEPDASLPSCLVTSAFDPVGIWFLGRKHDATYLAIDWRSSDELRVELLTSGALGEWRLTRKASRRGEVLVLDGPVKEYRRTDLFTRIHLVEVLGQQVLVPSAYVECLLAALGASPCRPPKDFDSAKACVFVRER